MTILLIAAILFALLQGAVAFGPLLGALMASALALAVVDVPGGLGVAEGVFLPLLGGEVASAGESAQLVHLGDVGEGRPALVGPDRVQVDHLGARLRRRLRRARGLRYRRLWRGCRCR